MFCEKCGVKLDDGSVFCSGCGTKVNDDNTTNLQNTNVTAPVQVVSVPTGTGPMVMGLLGMFGGFIPIVKYITGLLSVLAIIGGISQRKVIKNSGLPAGKATAGIVLGSIAVLITLLTITIPLLVVGSLFSGGSS